MRAAGGAATDRDERTSRSNSSQRGWDRHLVGQRIREPAGVDKDFLVGEPYGTSGKMTTPDRPRCSSPGTPRFVTMRGGVHLFQPSMASLRALADGSV